MIKKYCLDCGSKIEYRASEKPKFCPQCGVSLSKSKKANSANTLDKDQLGELPKIKSSIACEVSYDEVGELDVDISPFFRVRGAKFCDIIGTATGGEIEDDDWNPLTVENNPEEFRKEFLKEAGTIRKPGETPSEDK